MAVSDCSKPAHIQTLPAAGRDFKPLYPEELDALIVRFRPYARHIVYYRA